MYGNTYDLGDFDKCINFQSNNFQGKYCLVQYYPISSSVISVMPRENCYNQVWKNMNERFAGAVCIPSICDGNLIIPELMKQVLSGTDYVMADYYSSDDFCKVKKSFGLNASGLFGICFVLSFIILALLSTILSSKHPNSIYSSFCLVRNSRKLFNDRNESLTYLRGIRVISFLLAGLLHTILATIYVPPDDPRKVQMLLDSPFKIVIHHGVNSGVLCILLSIFLLTRIIWKLLQYEKLNIPMLYVYRYIRVIPVLIFVMIVEKYIKEDWIFQYVNVPFSFENQFPEIFKLYWLPLLNIQNFFVDFRNAYTPISFYFAVDFQLFLITPIVILAIWKWPQSRYFIFTSVIFVGVYICYSYLHEYQDYFFNLRHLAYEEKICSRYIQETQFFIIPWIMGIALGHFSMTNPKFKLTKFMKLFCWTLSIVLVALSWSRLYIPRFKNLIYFDKLLHGVCFFILIFVCHFGTPDLMLNFISKDFWIPFDRLGLGYYIAHSTIYRWFNYFLKIPASYNPTEFIINFLYGTIVSYFYALVMFLLIEQPVINIFKFYFNPSRPKINVAEDIDENTKL